MSTLKMLPFSISYNSWGPQVQWQSLWYSALEHNSVLAIISQNDDCVQAINRITHKSNFNLFCHYLSNYVCTTQDMPLHLSV